MRIMKEHGIDAKAHASGYKLPYDMPSLLSKPHTPMGSLLRDAQAKG